MGGESGVVIWGYGESNEIFSRTSKDKVGSSRGVVEDEIYYMEIYEGGLVMRI